MTRFVNKRLTDLERKVVPITAEPIPSIEPWMSAEQAMKILDQAVRRGRPLPTLSERELEGARAKGLSEEVKQALRKLDEAIHGP
jgi:hypothetical protein